MMVGKELLQIFDPHDKESFLTFFVTLASNDIDTIQATLLGLISDNLFAMTQDQYEDFTFNQLLPLLKAYEVLQDPRLFVTKPIDQIVLLSTHVYKMNESHLLKLYGCIVAVTIFNHGPEHNLEAWAKLLTADLGSLNHIPKLTGFWAVAVLNRSWVVRDPKIAQFKLALIPLLVGKSYNMTSKLSVDALLSVVGLVRDSAFTPQMCYYFFQSLFTNLKALLLLYVINPFSHHSLTGMLRPLQCWQK